MVSAACEIAEVFLPDECGIHRHAAVVDADGWEVRERLGAGAKFVVWVRGDGLSHCDQVDDIIVSGTTHAQPGDGEA